MNPEEYDFMEKLQKAKRMYGKIGYEVKEKDYFQKIYNYLKENNLDTTRFEEKLKKLQLVKTQKETYGTGAHYDEKDNKIVYTDEDDLYHEAFHVVTKGIVLKPKEGPKLGEGLNEGITDMFTKKVNPNAPTGYHFERICAEVLEKAYGTEVFNPYFEGSGLKFANQFDESAILCLMEDLDEYIELTREYYENMKNEQPILGIGEEIASCFDDVMKDLIDLCKDNSKKSIKEIKKLLETEFSSEEMKPIIGIIENGYGTSIDIQKLFSVEKTR